eukprot:scaffold5394_cov274-Prasinococcus_capsulatus_cf.AAC.5
MSCYGAARATAAASARAQCSAMQRSATQGRTCSAPVTKQASGWPPSRSSSRLCDASTGVNGPVAGQRRASLIQSKTHVQHTWELIGIRREKVPLDHPCISFTVGRHSMSILIRRVLGDGDPLMAHQG